MPEMDGYEATSAIRQSGGTYGDPKIPIVALTADVMEGTRERVIKLGMNGYIAKPFNQDNLYGTIKRIL
jgi:CheY-like chemotaxis protein